MAGGRAPGVERRGTPCGCPLRFERGRAVVNRKDMAWDRRGGSRSIPVAGTRRATTRAAPTKRVEKSARPDDFSDGRGSPLRTGREKREGSGSPSFDRNTGRGRVLGACAAEINLLRKRRIGPYFPDFSANRTTMHLKIVKIWPRFSTFSLRSFLPRRLLGPLPFHPICAEPVLESGLKSLAAGRPIRAGAFSTIPEFASGS